MGPRRRARECALMILYQIDVSGVPPETAIERFFASYGTEEPLDPPPPFAVEHGASAPSAVEHGADAGGPMEPDSRRYAEEIVRGVTSARETIDDVIQKVSHNWRLDRMATVDRNILRVGAYELTVRSEEVPRKVAINEALEIAKRFGTAESSAFINGILDRIGK